MSEDPERPTQLVRHGWKKREPVGWQPIETAPKDGTPVLVWFRGGAHVARYAPLWHPDNLRWIVNHPKWDDRDMQVVFEIEPNELQVRLGMVGPTLWMPIAPPEPR